MHLRYLQNDEGMNRVLFAPVRKYGNAVERNRARRIARESYRLLKHQLRRGFDLAFVLYNDADDLPNRSHQMTTVLQRAGLLIEERKE